MLPELFEESGSWDACNMISQRQNVSISSLLKGRVHLREKKIVITRVSKLMSNFEVVRKNEDRTKGFNKSRRRRVYWNYYIRL